MFRQLQIPTLILIGVVASISAANTPRTILFLGDSLTAGYGLDPSLAYPSLIQERIDASGLNYRILNGGLSGETTAGGLRRIQWMLRRPVGVIVIALGANDGLRGLKPEEFSTEPSVYHRHYPQEISSDKIPYCGHESAAQYGFGILCRV